MEILVGEKETQEYVEEAKKAFEKEKEVVIKGIARDTVKAVDVAELLKKEDITLDFILSEICSYFKNSIRKCEGKKQILQSRLEKIEEMNKILN